MNRSLLASFLGVFLGACCVGLNAAEPLVRIPAEALDCTVMVVSRKVSPVAAAPEKKTSLRNLTVKKADVLLFGKRLRLLITWSDGHPSEVWRANEQKLTVFADPNRPSIGVLRGYDFLPEVLHMNPEESWISWVSNEFLVGAETVRGQKCNHYQKTVSFIRPTAATPTADAGSAVTTVLYQAWVALDTLLPVAFDDGEARYDITFRPAPTEGPTPPPAIQKVMQRYVNALSAPKHL